ncbi:MAG TPA: filamentous hemagglutinin N-terminal domain-containing protein [Nitrospiraceae bacterium]|nr:filamentous hemagglutinin N-terminal domain-containing protein [Nitrospiraceae bacterium]
MSASQAQTPPPITSTTGIGNLGTTVTQSGNTYHITGGARPTNGPNLFHSFGNFNVPANNVANFVNDAGLPTTNILGRVTGGNLSSIFGTIQTTNFANANLFLMNPAGFLFGPTATLNVGGMVTFTSADYLRFSDNTRFNAVPNMAADALLSTAPVAAFGFLGTNPGAISIEGSKLTLAADQSISLIGGNITVQNGKLENGTTQTALLSSPNGRINLASVASPGEILAGTLDQAPNIDGQSFGPLGTIQVTSQSVIDASGDGGGTIAIRGGRLIVDDSMISANTTESAGPPAGPPGSGIDIQMSQDVLIRNRAILETNVTDDAAPGIGSGGVRVRANHIEIAGILDFLTFPFTGIRSNVSAESQGGRSGNISLDANSIVVKELGQIATFTEGSGHAGDIALRAKERLEISTVGFIQSASRFASGNAGDIELTSTHGNITMPTAFVTTQTEQSSGNAGTIMVNAPNGDITLTAQSSLFNATRGTGSLGGIQIKAKNLRVLNGSRIQGDNFSTLAPGPIAVNLSGNLSLDGESAIQTISRGAAPAADLTITAHEIHVAGDSSLSTETFGTGTGGRLNLVTEHVRLSDGGQVRSGSAFDPFPPPNRPRVSPSGHGGTITIQGQLGPAGSVVIEGLDSGIFTTAEGTGQGGNTNISARTVTIQNGGTISAATSGIASSATGGNITISSVQSTTLDNGGSITASSTGPGNAGNITINAGQTFTSTNSSVTTEAAQASGGNITVLATDSVRLTNSQLNASVQGSTTTVGGNITIDPQAVILQNSQIIANATQGQGGNISITTQSFLADATSVIDASSQFGISGTVNIQSPTAQMAGRLVALPKNPLTATSLFSQRCAALTGGQFSSFVVAGRYGLPPEPGGWLTSPFAWDGPGSPAAAQDEAPLFARNFMDAHSTPDTFSIRRWPGSSAAAGHPMFDWTAGCGS